MPDTDNSVVVIVPGATDPLRAQYLALFPDPEGSETGGLSFPSLLRSDGDPKTVIDPETVIDAWRRTIQPTINIENIAAHKGWFTLLLNDLHLQGGQRESALNLWDEMYIGICGYQNLEEISAFRRAMMNGLAKGAEGQVPPRPIKRLLMTIGGALATIVATIIGWLLLQGVPV